MVRTISQKAIGIKADVIRDEIFGATDGVISTLAVIAGVAGATSNNFIVLVAGASAMVAEAVSMGFSAYSGAKAREALLGKRVHKPVSEALLFWLATMGGGLVPLLPFLIPHTAHLEISVILSVIFLFAVGANSARVVGDNILKTGFRSAALGLIAAAITYFIGTGFAKISILLSLA